MRLWYWYCVNVMGVERGSGYILKFLVENFFLEGSDVIIRVCGIILNCYWIVC